MKLQQKIIVMFVTKKNTKLEGGRKEKQKSKTQNQAYTTISQNYADVFDLVLLRSTYFLIPKLLCSD